MVAGPLLAGAVFAFTSATSADRIVLRDGTSIETRGAVKLDGRQAVYTDLSGRLVAMRVEEIDLARTKALVGAVATSSARTLPPPAPPVLRLTDADVGHVADGDPGGAATAGEVPIVTLYSTSWCGWCRRSRDLMTALGIPFVEKDVEHDSQAAAEKYRLAGPRAGVPVLVRGDQVVQGFSEATLRSWAPRAAPPRAASTPSTPEH
jgi:glutaredoxin